MSENNQPKAVTIDDVKTVIAEHEIDPNSTNANAIRKLLGGTGSNQTIQKHLNAIRAEVNPQPVGLDEGVSVPAMPAILRSAMEETWGSAWTAAQGATAQALAKALLERDQAIEKLAMAEADLNQANADLDKEREDYSTNEDMLVQVTRRRDGLMDEIQELRGEIIEINEGKHQALKDKDAELALAKSLWETQRVTLQGEIDKLVDKLAEVKANQKTLLDEVRAELKADYDKRLVEQKGAK